MAAVAPARRRLGAVAAHLASEDTVRRGADVPAREPLNEKEVERFLSDGYVVLPGLLGDGPGSMNDALRPSWFTAVPRRTARMDCFSFWASDKRVKTAAPQPSPRA